jgi:hypothetical protein
MTPYLPPNYYPFSVCLIMGATISFSIDFNGEVGEFDSKKEAYKLLF